MLKSRKRYGSDVHSKYKVAKQNWTTSGNHAEFRSYCDSSGQVYYLHQLVQVKTNAVNYVDPEQVDTGQVDTGRLQVVEIKNSNVKPKTKMCRRE